MHSLDDVVSDQDFGKPDKNDDQPKQTILSVDDGGVRGYVSLLVLRALMVKIDFWEHEREYGQERNNSSNNATTNDGLSPHSHSSTLPVSFSIARATTADSGLSASMEPIHYATNDPKDPHDTSTLSWALVRAGKINIINCIS